MLLKNLALVVLKAVVAGETSVDEEEGPGHQDVDNQEVDEDGGDVPVPGAVEVGVEGEGAELEEVLDVGRDGSENGYVVVGSEPKDVGVDQHRHQHRVEDKEYRVNDDLDSHA